MARLILNWEGVDLLTHELVDDVVMIGRAPSNQIVIDHLAVSAQHAVLLRVSASYWLKDLNTTNRTQINGVLVTEAELNDGDKIQFGSVKAVFAGCSRKRWSTCAIRNFWTSSTTTPETSAAAEGNAKGKMGFNDSSKEKLEQIDNDAMRRGMTHHQLMQDGIEEFYTRKAIGESLLGHLDKEMGTCVRATHRSAIDFWVRHIRDLKDR
jgi:hypothetical protein